MPRKAKQGPGTSQQLAELAKTMREGRSAYSREALDDAPAITCGYSPEASAAAVMARLQAVEEGVTEALGLLPDAVLALRTVMNSDDAPPAAKVAAARAVLEVAQLIGPRTVNRLDGAGTSSMTIGELETSIGQTRALLEQRQRAERIVATQAATHATEESEPQPV